MPVVGVGGFFFRARDPQALLQWYRDHLGVTPQGYEPWQQEAGPTMIQPFAQDSDNIPDGKTWAINFRVTEFDQLLATLRAAGVEVATNPEWDSPEAGRFARIHDPEGNQVELWEPPAE